MAIGPIEPVSPVTEIDPVTDTQVLPQNLPQQPVDPQPEIDETNAELEEDFQESVEDNQRAEDQRLNTQRQDTQRLDAQRREALRIENERAIAANDPRLITERDSQTLAAESLSENTPIENAALRVS
jgi:hypothetical protein